MMMDDSQDPFGSVTFIATNEVGKRKKYEQKYRKAWEKEEIFKGDFFY